MSVGLFRSTRSSVVSAADTLFSASSSGWVAAFALTAGMMLSTVCSFLSSVEGHQLVAGARPGRPARPRRPTTSSRGRLVPDWPLEPQAASVRVSRSSPAVPSVPRVRCAWRPPSVSRHRALPDACLAGPYGPARRPTPARGYDNRNRGRVTNTATEPRYGVGLGPVAPGTHRGTRRPRPRRRATPRSRPGVTWRWTSASDSSVARASAATRMPPAMIWPGSCWPKPVVDDDAQARRRPPGRQRRGRDDLDRRGPEAGRDQRYGERQLDPGSTDLARTGPSAGRLDDVRVDLADADVGVGQQRRDREDCQRDDRRPVAEADRGGGEDGQQRQGRDGARDVGHGDGEAAAAARCGRARARAAAPPARRGTPRRTGDVEVLARSGAGRLAGPASSTGR